MTDFQPIRLIPPAADAAIDAAARAEDAARADLYGLLATLFYRAPDAVLLHHIAANRAHGDDAGTALGDAWNGLCDAASGTAAADAAGEYQALFGRDGAAAAPVPLQGGGYARGCALPALRGDLARYGLVRRAGVGESEDHLGTLCEVMRVLMAGEQAGAGGPAEQRRFFARHLLPWADDFGGTLAAHPRACFYARVARLFAAFVAVEASALGLA
ncbi:TorD/DmsD family molecular chaperone [Cupriavidus sp. 30B13]|uniref:TorD/DmsD family molecular chaperone n=1 Tax=Cupriavidus sp. 30B13 TaxID=3384241 RepID=UPI003B9207BB